MCLYARLGVGGLLWQTNWPLQMTAAVIVLTPLLFVFLFTQRFFTRGITMGSFR